MRAGAGCTHFIIGRDMAGSKSSLTGEDFYGAYDAQETARANCQELGMDIVPSLNITYTEARTGGHAAGGVDVRGLPSRASLHARRSAPVPHHHQTWTGSQIASAACCLRSCTHKYWQSAHFRAGCAGMLGFLRPGSVLPAPPGEGLCDSRRGGG